MVSVNSHWKDILLHVVCCMIKGSQWDIAAEALQPDTFLPH